MAVIREVVQGPNALDTAVGPGLVDRCTLLGNRILTAATILLTYFLFPIPFIPMIALLSPFQ